MAKNLSTIDTIAYFIVLGDTVPKRIHENILKIDRPLSNISSGWINLPMICCALSSSTAILPFNRPNKRARLVTPQSGKLMLSKSKG